MNRLQSRFRQLSGRQPDRFKEPIGLCPAEENRTEQQARKKTGWPFFSVRSKLNMITIVYTFIHEPYQLVKKYVENAQH